nr:sugar transferase [Dubosiella newyorkensis]
MWQTHGRSDVDFEHRLELDEYYYRNWSIWLDLTLLVRTIKQVLSKEEHGAM